MPVTYTLDDGVMLNREFPATFLIPPEDERIGLSTGDFVKLIFRIETDDDTAVERMWVKVTEVRASGYLGILDNDALCTEAIRSGMQIEFHADHVIQIYRD